MKRWLVNFHNDDWYEWATLESKGRVSTYDKQGHFVRGTDYGNWWRARASLKRMGYHRPTREERKLISPPQLGK